LVSARRIYQAAGFRLVHEEQHHSFGQDLVGQYWELIVKAMVVSYPFSDTGCRASPR
jgi:hypothetical protein